MYAQVTSWISAHFFSDIAEVVFVYFFSYTMESCLIFHVLELIESRERRGKLKQYIDEQMAMVEPNSMRMRGVECGSAASHFHYILDLWLTTCVAYKSVGPRAAAPS